VAQFWSVTVYDNETRCFVNTGVSPDRSSRDAIVTNPDGSVDLMFGPAAARRHAGEQLDQDTLGQGLVQLLPPVRPDRGLLQPLVGAI
jgi:hypothetical protein